MPRFRISTALSLSATKSWRDVPAKFGNCCIHSLSFCICWFPQCFVRKFRALCSHWFCTVCLFPSFCSPRRKFRICCGLFQRWVFPVCRFQCLLWKSNVTCWLEAFMFRLWVHSAFLRSFTSPFRVISYFWQLIIHPSGIFLVIIGFRPGRFLLWVFPIIFFWTISRLVPFLFLTFSFRDGHRPFTFWLASIFRSFQISENLILRFDPKSPASCFSTHPFEALPGWVRPFSFRCSISRFCPVVQCLRFFRLAHRFGIRLWSFFSEVLTFPRSRIAVDSKGIQSSFAVPH